MESLCAYSMQDLTVNTLTETELIGYPPVKSSEYVLLYIVCVGIILASVDIMMTAYS